MADPAFEALRAELPDWTEYPFGSSGAIVRVAPGVDPHDSSFTGKTRVYAHPSDTPAEVRERARAAREAFEAGRAYYVPLGWSSDQPLHYVKPPGLKPDAG